MSQAALSDSPFSDKHPSSPLLEQIRTMVRRNTRRWKVLTVLEGVGLSVSGVLAYLWLVFWLDNVVHLGRGWRIAAGLGLLAAFVVLGVGLVRRWRQLRFTEDQVALAIERRTHGGVQNRLINALQLARSDGGQSAMLTRAAIEENVTRMQELELEQAAALRPALVRVAIAAGLIAAGVGFYYLQPDRFTNAAQRILLPFVDVEPIYDTRLSVEPGDVETVDDVELTITIHGIQPKELMLLEEIDGKRTSTPIALRANADTVRHTIRAVPQSRRYAVRGGDYTSPFYQITVPTPSRLSLMTADYHFPKYTGLADKRTESASGNLDALYGTTVDLNFTFDRPCDDANLLIEQPSSKDGKSITSVERVALKSVGNAQFTGTLKIGEQTGYRLETRQMGREPHVGKLYSIRALPDLEPKLELTGFESKSETAVDAVITYRAVASDDWGLADVGLFMRRIAAGQDDKQQADWQPVESWPGEGNTKFEQGGELTLLALTVAEGDQLELALRAKDRDPAKADRWTSGTIFTLDVGGDSAALQLLYEQILRTEAELKKLLADQRRVLIQTVDWLRKLDGEGDLNWDDKKNVAALHKAIAELNQQQAALREKAGGIARSMAAEAGSLPMSVALLADTEMVRAERIFDSVATRDSQQAKRSAVSDAQITEQRTITSLQQMYDQYVQFRQDWELDHLTPFVKMLAERQAALRETSLNNEKRPQDKLSKPWQASAARRQEKLAELRGLAETGLMGVSDKLADLNSPLAEAFGKAGEDLAAEDLLTAIDRATAAINAGKWNEAAAQQAIAAERLLAVHDALRKAQLDAARDTLAAIDDLAKSNLDAQKEIEKLKQGPDKNVARMPEDLSVANLVEMREKVDIERKKRESGEDDPSKVIDYKLSEKQIAGFDRPDDGRRQDFNLLKLGDGPGGDTQKYPGTSDTGHMNEVNAPINEDLKDLVGELIEEADEMDKNFETATINTGSTINEPGEVGKLAGDLNSFAAAATTGNKKPPTRNVGGASQSGRRGARAHGIVVGDETVNRRGRDQVQEGQERVADQDGLMKETMSDDPQKDTSTGVGGKRIDSDDTKFSVADVGKWTDDMADRMGKPQKKNYLVERQDGRMDPEVAELLRDMTSDQEQIIERAKTIRKELKNLYLPTDHLDEIIAELEGQLSQLKERPTPELFRLQQQTLDKLRGTMRVFHQATSNFQPSLPREQVVKGRVLDEADRPPPPEYAEAIKRYYEILSAGGPQSPTP